MNKVKLTFVLPSTLQQELREKIIRDSYDMKGKSRWIAEAVERLLATKGYPDLVKINDEMKNFAKQESVLMTPELKRQLDGAIVDVRVKYPTIEGVQSRIIRTAIVQRLLRG